MTDDCPRCGLPYPWGDPAQVTGAPCFDCREKIRSHRPHVVSDAPRVTARETARPVTSPVTVNDREQERP